MSAAPKSRLGRGLGGLIAAAKPATPAPAASSHAPASPGGDGASVEDALEKLQYDLYYIKNLSLFLDLLILINTIQVVLFARGR